MSRAIYERELEARMLCEIKAHRERKESEGFIFWNGLFCRVISRDNAPIWELETMTGARYAVHYFELELAHFEIKRKRTK